MLILRKRGPYFDLNCPCWEYFNEGGQGVRPQTTSKVKHCDRALLFNVVFTHTKFHVRVFPSLRSSY